MNSFQKCAASIALATAMLAPLSAAAVEYVARHGLSSAQYQAEFNKYVGQGYRLTAVDGYATPAGMRYAAMWQRRGGPAWVARHGMGAGTYQAEFNKYTKQGYRPSDISVSGLGNSAGNFAALWERRTGRWVARHGLTSAQYQAAFDNATAKGYRPVHVDGYWTPAGVRYAAIWEKRGGPRWVARHGLSSAQYQAAFNKLSGQGYSLVSVSGYWDGQQSRYAAIWSR